jgi:hypothetical protein
MKLSEKAEAALKDVVAMIDSGAFPERAALALFPALDVPCSGYSLLNRLIVADAETGDVRGYKAWQAAGRQVRAGARAVWIFAPNKMRLEVEDPATGEKKTIYKVTGFRVIPVFRVEDTDGEPLPYKPLEPPAAPALADVARQWGISVKYVPCNGTWAGSFQPALGAIELASPDEAVFFHELAHAAHARIEARKYKSLVGGQDAGQEIIAELSAVALARLFGLNLNGRSFGYIAEYAKASGKSSAEAVLAVLGTVEKVLAEILGAHEEAPAAAAA